MAARDTDRRTVLKTAGFGALAALPSPVLASTAATTTIWARGIEGQRRADLGNGTFLNPIMAGDHPDPSLLKDGKDYYMTFSTFDAYPGLAIWHSCDLVNWQPVTTALKTNVGSVWAPELCKHQGRYYLYIPAKNSGHDSIYVVWADRIAGPWSAPIDLNLPHHIDPGHAVDHDGARWLFLNGGDRVRLSPDGLKRIDDPEHVYDPWQYPESTASDGVRSGEWETESFSPEGPKVLRHGKYYYLISAIGGTAGPPTGHMVIAARAKTLTGPWEQHPGNPLVHTRSAVEKWWSRGHATLVEGPAGDWWGVYHGFENGFWTLGRQTLLAPVTWTDDGWFCFGGGDLSQALSKPAGGQPQPHGMALSDDFTTDKYGLQWRFFAPSAAEASRLRRENGVLHLRASGASPKDSAPLLTIVGDQAYEIQCEIEVTAGASAGLVLFYDHGLYCGLGFDEQHFVTHQYGRDRGRPTNPYGSRLWMRLRNDRQIVTVYTSADCKIWKRFDRGMEVSGYHHNVRGGFLMLKPGLYAAGTGEARFRDFRYRAL